MTEAPRYPTGVPLLIEASAGTGKTWTLEQIVLERLRAGAPIESILVVTFTDKATREMRARVRATLEARVAAGELTLRPALLSFERAPISTIHSFCQRLLREHAFDGGRQLREERTPESALVSRALLATLRAGLVPGAPLEPYLLAAIEVLGTEGLTAAVVALAHERGDLEPRFSLPALTAALDHLAAAGDAEVHAQVTHAGSRGRALRDLTALAAARDGTGPESVVRSLGRLLAWAEAGEPARAPWLAELLASTSLGPSLAVVRDALSGPAPMLVAHVLPTVRERVLEEKRALGAVDYDDLLLDLRSALRSSGGELLRARVRSRIAHVLVDEFQDTDPVQWEIFRTLFFDTSGGRSLVLIGDPKQAIYSFRGADLRTYERARDEVRAVGGEVRYLAESHRSSPRLVEALHRVLLPGEGEEPYFHHHNAYPAPVVAAHDRPLALRGDAEPAPITLFQLESEAPLRVRRARLALGRAMAAEIHDLLATPPVLVLRDGSRRPLRASDVFVLVRSAGEAKEIGQALARRAVPHAFVKEEGLFSTGEARDLLDVLRALLSPDHALFRARALLTPFFAVALEDLPAVRGEGRGHPALATFFELAQLAQRGELAMLFSALLDRAGLLRRELYLFESERRLTNYLHLTEIALELAREGHAGLSGVVRALEDRIEGRTGESDEDVQRLESERDAVQILTMHKAKGLEAHFVFVYGGFGKPPLHRDGRRTYHEDDGRRVTRVGPAPPAIEARLRDEEQEENERLLYVAMTRAKACLYLPYTGRGAGSTPGEPALTFRAKGPIAVVMRRLVEIVPRATPGSRDDELFRRVTVDVDQAATGPRGPRKAPIGRTRAEVVAVAETRPLDDAAMESLRAQAAGHVMTSYTRMKAERARALGDPSDDDSDRLADKSDDGDARGSAADPGGPAFGVAVHALLEKVDPARAIAAASPEAFAADPAVLALATEVLAASGVGEEAQPRAIELAWRGLRAPMALPGLSLPEGLAVLSRRAVEIPFVHPIPERAHAPLGARATTPAGRGFVRGVIDLLFEHEGRTWVVDWKTDRLDDYGPEAVRAHVEAGYAVQLRLYSLAAARMPGLGGEEAWNARFGGVLYVFLRGLGESPRGALHHVRPSWAELRAWDDAMRSSDAPWDYPLGRPA